jgi:hypothetical protein
MNNQEINQLKQLVEKANKTIETHEAKEWPQDGDDMCVVYADGSLRSDKFCSAYSGHLKQGRIFRTLKEAERLRDREALLAKLWRESKFKPDWSDGGQGKFYPTYDHGVKTWLVTFDWLQQENFTFPHYATRRECEEVIEANDFNLFLED